MESVTLFSIARSALPPLMLDASEDDECTHFSPNDPILPTDVSGDIILRLRRLTKMSAVQYKAITRSLCSFLTLILEFTNKYCFDD